MGAQVGGKIMLVPFYIIMMLNWMNVYNEETLHALLKIRNDHEIAVQRTLQRLRFRSTSFAHSKNLQPQN